MNYICESIGGLKILGTTFIIVPIILIFHLAFDTIKLVFSNSEETNIVIIIKRMALYILI